MKASAGELVDGDDWIHELKWDGMRGVVFVEEGDIRIQSRNGNDATAAYPELAAMGSALATFGPLVVDGEIVAVDDAGTPSFSRLQDRMHVQDPVEASRRSVSTPVTFIGFDLLHLGGHDLMGLAWEDRRNLLEQVLEEGGEWWRCASVHEGDAAALLEVVTERGLEGIVSKQRRSAYHPGKRSPSWRKIKPRRRQEFVVGGWSTGRDGRAGGIGSLLLGVQDGGGLRYVGSVGSGLDGASLEAWMQRVEEAARASSPFDGPVPPSPGRTHRWVEPTHVVEVAFGEWTPDGHLRHPSLLGLRTDKDPSEVVREA